jgi:hypothetical protein
MRTFTKAAALTFGLAVLMFSWGSLPFSQTGFAQTSCNSEFGGSSLDPGLSAYVPKSGPTFSLTTNPGHLRMSLPGNDRFDHWTFVDGSPQIRCTAPTGNFELITKVKAILPTGTPLNYHVGLVIDFSQRDAIYWGDYQGNEIRMERSGIRPGISAGLSNPNAELELKISKIGNDYTFSYRAAGAAAWIDVGTYNTAKAPKFVGIIGKTWNLVRLLADFDYLHLNSL